MTSKLKVWQVAGYKNAGKTTLVCELVGFFSARGLRVGTLKRDAHGFEPEPEGVDTRLHREAGALLTALSSDELTQWVQAKPTPLDELLLQMEAEGVDAVVLEGFKTAPYPKIVLIRGDEDAELLQLPGIIAVALRNEAPVVERSAVAAGLPLFRTDGFDFEALLHYIDQWEQERTL